MYVGNMLASFRGDVLAVVAELEGKSWTRQAKK
jgi:hypothetical protein